MLVMFETSFAQGFVPTYLWPHSLATYLWPFLVDRLGTWNGCWWRNQFTRLPGKKEKKKRSQIWRGKHNVHFWSSAKLSTQPRDVQAKYAFVSNFDRRVKIKSRFEFNYFFLKKWKILLVIKFGPIVRKGGFDAKFDYLKKMSDPIELSIERLNGSLQILCGEVTVTFKINTSSNPTAISKAESYVIWHDLPWSCYFWRQCLIFFCWKKKLPFETKKNSQKISEKGKRMATSNLKLRLDRENMYRSI